MLAASCRCCSQAAAATPIQRLLPGAWRHPIPWRSRRRHRPSSPPRLVYGRKGAAASTAAHHVLIALVDQTPVTTTLTADVKSAIKARLDAEYASSLAEDPDGDAKTSGINVGAAAASAMLALRAADGRFGAPG